MRITAVQRIQSENRIRAAMDGYCAARSHRRPFLPQKSGERAAVGIQPGPAAVAMQVVLVPQPLRSNSGGAGVAAAEMF